ncbi:outer membrane beta-barrel protein [Rhodovibrio sodomensis]|uniref:outer membrane beta-barrel protein n=1 Tax=Rhodovibrio sodomensis TaxID=1088 RepID=UPI00308403B6
MEFVERTRLTPRFERFARSRINARLYDTAVDDQGYARDSYGHATVAGLTWRPTGLTTLEGYSGLRQQVYADPRFDALFVPTAGLRIVTSPSQLTSLRLALDQSVRETTTPAASGRLVTALTAQLDHELQRDLLARLQLRYAVDDYRGSGRRDEDVAAGVSLTYFASRHLHARLSLRHARLESNRAGVRSFRRNQFEFSLEVRY